MEETERGMLWRVFSSKTKKTRKIPVQKEVAILTRRLLKTAPKGSGKPLFRNTKGRPWQRMNGVVRFLALKTETWLESGSNETEVLVLFLPTHVRIACSPASGPAALAVPLRTLAELMGDTPATTFNHYGREWGQHYQAPLWAAIGAGKPSPRTTEKATYSAWGLKLIRTEAVANRCP